MIELKNNYLKCETLIIDDVTNEEIKSLTFINLNETIIYAHKIDNNTTGILIGDNYFKINTPITLLLNTIGIESGHN